MKTTPIGQYLYEQWQIRIDSQYLYRGMSAKDLSDPLDPTCDPFTPIRQPLLELIGRLYRLLDAGFEFTVHEDYSGYAFALRDILNWTSRDLANPGLDFTSSHESACGYVQNYQGSQLKQNFKYITDNLPQRRDDPCVLELWTADDWQRVTAVNQWISEASPGHQRVVIWVSRSHPAFESDRPECLLRGSFAFFQRRVLEILELQGLPQSVDAIAEILPPADHQFDIRMTSPLVLADISRIESR